MKKQFLAAFVTVALTLSGCSSEEPPSELDILIEQLQTTQITSETVPEETSENMPEPENTEETSEEISSVENTGEATEDSSIPDNTEDISENTEETEDSSENNGSEPVTYYSITVTVLSVEDDKISVESEGIIYNISIGENTGIFGGDISEGKTVTITYIVNNEDSESNITAAAITVLPDN